MLLAWWRNWFWLVVGATFAASCSLDDPLNPQPEPPGDNANPTGKGGANGNYAAAGGEQASGYGGHTSLAPLGGSGTTIGQIGGVPTGGGAFTAGTSSPGSTGGARSTGGAAASTGSGGAASTGGKAAFGGSFSAGGMASGTGGATTTAASGGRVSDADAGMTTGGTSAGCSIDAATAEDAGCP